MTPKKIINVTAENISNINDEGAILDLQLKLLISHGDSRGYFREIVRATDRLFDDGVFGQWSHSKMQKNVVKAWHYHHVQYDWWYVPIGAVEAVFFDNREESPTFGTKLACIMGDSFAEARALPICVRIPPWVLHACKVLSNEAHLFYITSQTYDKNEEGRFPYNSDVVGHDWGSNIIVAANDTLEFKPTSIRKTVN